MIATRNVNYKAHVFSYSFGSEADKSVPIQLACSTNGLWKQIQDSGDLRAQMAEYYNYYAYDIKQTRKSVWSELYQDFSLNITMATSASPCFAIYGKLLGVSGVDVPLTDLLAIHNNLNEIKTELKSRSAICPDFELNTENLATLRGGKCNYCNGNCGASLNTDLLGYVLGIVGGGFGLTIVLPLILAALCCGLCLCICGPFFCCRSGSKKNSSKTVPPGRRQEYRAPSTTNTTHEETITSGERYEMELIKREESETKGYIPPTIIQQPSYNPQFVEEQTNYVQNQQFQFDPNQQFMYAPNNNYVDQQMQQVQQQYDSNQLNQNFDPFGAPMNDNLQQ